MKAKLHAERHTLQCLQMGGRLMRGWSAKGGRASASSGHMMKVESQELTFVPKVSADDWELET
jgi:hypothetical protein